VLDLLHRHLCAWLAPVLVFTAEEAWLVRFEGGEESVHLQDFPAVPAEWQDEALAEKWKRVRETRSFITGVLEDARRAGNIGSSLQAKITFTTDDAERFLLPTEEWEEVLIVSQVDVASGLAGMGTGITQHFAPAPGTKCARCWRVLPEVGASSAHPTLCLRCESVVEAQEQAPAAA